MISTSLNTAGLLAASVQPFVDSHVIAGAVLLTGSSRNAPAAEALGYANIAAQAPMQLDTMFWIASNSKAITAAALMLLVDEGQIALEDPAAKYLPEFQGQMVVAEEDDTQKVLHPPQRPVNLRDLLSHTSGILPWFYDGRLNAGTLRERTLACGLMPLRFGPGTKWEYGNGGFEVAGRIIEIASKQPLEAFMQTRLFDPLGMTDTTFWPSEAQIERLAIPYAPSQDGQSLAEASLPFTYPLSGMSGSPSPGGGLFSTGGDCFKFAQMIAAGGVVEGQRLLSEAAVRTITTTQTGTLLSAPGNENGYGLGWHTTSRDQGKPWPEGVSAAHHGGAYGTNIRIDPQTDQIDVFMVAQAGWKPPFDGDQVLRAFWEASGTAREGNST